MSMRKKSSHKMIVKILFFLKKDRYKIKSLIRILWQCKTILHYQPIKISQSYTSLFVLKIEKIK